jgi:signal transduction histidine kinase
VLIDRRRCERVLLNLISNANRYTQPGGKIRVDVQVELTYLITSVVDTGQGVPADELDKIFSVYYRNSTADGKGAGSSSGLGLAIAKYLVELHGGRIWVDSKVGVGSSFHYSLPLGVRNESLSYR